jgi:hypothetical protein
MMVASGASGCNWVRARSLLAIVLFLVLSGAFAFYASRFGLVGGEICRVGCGTEPLLTPGAAHTGRERRSAGTRAFPSFSLWAPDKPRAQERRRGGFPRWPGRPSATEEVGRGCGCPRHHV